MSFLNKGFKASKCKTQLKLTIPRIKLLRNRKEFQLKQMRKDIAKLLEAGQEATARIRVEHIIREENMMAAQEIIELFCELISVRLPIIETQRECPLDLKEAISSICFAAPRCADLPELQQVQLAFVSKYGKEFVASASALMPDCGVNRQLVELLSVRAPSPEKKLNLLKEIAEKHDLHWDPAPSETELFKSHEDLLNGPTQFVSGFKAPLPKENDEILQSTLVHTKSKEDELEFPEVTKVSLWPSAKEDKHPSSGMPVESLGPTQFVSGFKASLPKENDEILQSTLVHTESKEDDLEFTEVTKVSLWPSAKEDMHPSSGMPVESLGPTQFVSGFKAPLPKENDEILQSTLVHTESKEDDLEFPEVTKVSLWPSAKEDMHPSSGMPVESSGPTQFVSGFKAPLPKENDEILQPTLVHTESKEHDLEFPEVTKVSLWPSAKEDMHPSSGMPVESSGPTQFFSGFKAPLPKENDEILQSTLVHTESKEDFDELEFPEVPKVSLWPSAKEELHPSSGMPDESLGPTQFVSGFKAPLPKENDEILQSTLVHTESEEDCDQLELPEVPKVSLWPSAKEVMDPSPGMSVESLDKSCNQSISNTKDISQAADHEFPKSLANTGISKQSVPFISPPSMSLASAPVQEITQPPNPLTTKSGARVNLNDILAAAKAAAESADRAAVAARAAAILVELRISELIESRSGHSLDMEVENPFHISAEMEKAGDNPSIPADHFENTHIENMSKDGLDGVTEPKTSLPAENSYIKSVNDESMFSYPNLFSSQSPETHTPETRIGHG